MCRVARSFLLAIVAAALALEPVGAAINYPGGGIFKGTSPSIGGTTLLAGNCVVSAGVTITGVTTAMVVAVSPVSNSVAGTYWDGYVSAPNTVIVRVCAAVASTPTASVYNIRVLP